MTSAELRECCLARPGAYEDHPFGPVHTVFKVAGKLFAISDLDASPISVSLKCEPELAVQLRASHPSITPGYHLNRRHWNEVRVEELPDEMVRDLVEDSYDLVVEGLPRRERERLGWAPGA